MIEQGSYRFVKTAAVYKHGPHVGWFVGGLCTIEATPCQVEDVYLAYGVDLRHLLHKRGIQQESTSGYLMMSELTEEGEQGQRKPHTYLGSTRKTWANPLQTRRPRRNAAAARSAVARRRCKGDRAQPAKLSRRKNAGAARVVSQDWD